MISDYSQTMAETTTSADTAIVRRFNRAWSREVGALEESFLGTGRSLGASRLLFEMGPSGAGILHLRRRLGLDSGYLSRLLRGLEDEGLVEVRPDPEDQRRRVVVPTPRGRTAIDRLETRSEWRAHHLVATLGPSQRRRLVDALGTAEVLVRAATCEIARVDVRSAEAVDAVAHYFAELDERFPGGFDPGEVTRTDLEAMTPPYGLFLVARAGDEVIACGGLQRHEQTVAEIKRMWVSSAWRGCGLGSRVLAALEDGARGLGYLEVRLDTNPALVEAIAMYERSGYHHIDRYSDNPYAGAWFAKTLGSATP